MNRSLHMMWGVVGIALVVSLLSLFVVDERQWAMVDVFGRIQTDAQGHPKVLDAGLHTRWPLIASVHRFEKRLQTLEIVQSRIVTADQKSVMVDSYVKWRIQKPGLLTYYKATKGDKRRTDLLLTRLVGDALRAQFGLHTVTEVLKDERSRIMTLLQEHVNAKADDLGIAVLDVRIKRIDLPTNVSESVYNQMRSKRAEAATDYRARGARDGEKIRAEADAKVAFILADAARQSKSIRGEGEAQAAKIYADAYQKAPSFARFYQQLMAYQRAFGQGRTTVLLDPQHDAMEGLSSHGRPAS